jgi:methyl-accepting chemotaxis protein
MNKPSFKRKNIFIDKQFQAQFILKFCTLVAIGGLLTIAILYFWAGKSTTVSVVNSRVAVRSTADFLLPLLIQTVLIVLVIVGFATILVTLFVSHKIAGPLYRLKKAMQNLEEGNLVEDFRIRRNDQLQNIAETFNNTIKKIREVIKNLKTNIPHLKEKLDSIQEHELSEQKRAILSELKRISDDLNKLVNYFKT